MGNHTRLEEAKQDKFKKKIEEAINEIILPLKKENEELKQRVSQLELFVSGLNEGLQLQISRIDKMDHYQNVVGAQLRVNVQDLNKKVQNFQKPKEDGRPDKTN